MQQHCKAGTNDISALMCKHGAVRPFDWTDLDGKSTGGTTAWLIVPQDSNQFAPGSAPFMVNYRVENLQNLVAVLKAEGCNILDEIIDTEFGKFAHILDPEGNKVELWQPPTGL